MARPQSARLLLIGVAVLIVGAGLVLVVVRSGDSTPHPGATATTLATVPNRTATGGGAAAVAAAPAFGIPEGKQAVAVQLPFTNGLGGYAQAGDRVNVFALTEKGRASGAAPPFAKLILSGVPVLAVTAPPPSAGTGNVTYLLALDPTQAEQVIFFAKFESLWLSIVPKEQKPVATPGHGYDNAL